MPRVETIALLLLLLLPTLALAQAPKEGILWKP